MKVAVSASSFAEGDKTSLNMLTQKGLEVILNPYGRRLKNEEIASFIGEAAGLLAGLERLDETVFQKTPNLKAIARIGVGVENVNFEAAARYGIKVSNTPEAPSRAVAELTLTVLLSVIRQLNSANNDMHAGIWKKRLGRSLSGFTVLLVGYGRIAQRFEELLAPFGTKILIADPYKPELSTGSLEEQLPLADAISLHASGSIAIIGERELALMKEGAVLLNSARGALAAEEAVVRALKSGRLSCYWADAFSEEPYTGELTSLPNAVLTPHIATYTAECRKQMEEQAAKNLLKDLNL